MREKIDMISKEIREQVKNFFINANDKIFHLNDKCKVFTCDRNIEGFFAVWYNECIINDCHVLFERKPIPNKSDYITKIIVEAGDELTMIADINKNGAVIKVTAPEENLHEVAVVMSDNLIDYIADVHTYSF